MKPQLRRLLVAIIAWPAGILAALLVLIIPAFFDSPCPPGPVCVQALEPTSWTRTILWLAIAFGPGVVATWTWWKGRGARS